MQSHKKLLKRKDIEQLENTSLAAVGLLDHNNPIGLCADTGLGGVATCSCETTVVQCCEGGTVPPMTGPTA